VFLRIVWGQEYVIMCILDGNSSNGCSGTNSDDSGTNVMVPGTQASAGTPLNAFMEWTLKWNTNNNAWLIQAGQLSAAGSTRYLKKGVGVGYDTTKVTGMRATYSFTGMFAQVVDASPTQISNDTSFYWNIQAKGDPGEVAIENLNGGWLGKFCRFNNLYPTVCNPLDVNKDQNMLMVYDTFGWTRNLLEIGVYQSGATDPQQLTACQPTPDWTS